MDDLTSIVVAAQGGDIDAFTTLVQRFQDLAFGAAYARLSDSQLAQDVAQEAFLQAYRDLSMLRQPNAFPQWLRRIVAKHSDRVVRGRRLLTVPLEVARFAGDEQSEPGRLVEARELEDLVRSEIARLPERERVAVTLFYVADRAQSDIAAFLEVPTSTIKKRLFDARRRLKERMMSQLGDHLREQRPSQDERFMRRVQFLIAVRTGDLPVIQRQLETDPSLVHVTLTGEEWGRAEMGQPTLPMEFDYTPLHFAATYGPPELAELLLARGAKVDDATPGETPLSRAVLMHDVPMTELLLRHGANPNLVSVAGLTPLHRAAMRGHAAVVGTLLAHGADADQRDRSGRTARDWAVLGGWQGVVDALAGNASNPPVDPGPASESTALLGRIVDSSGKPLDGRGPVPNIVPAVTPPEGARVSGELLETGIKVVDLLAPLPRGGTVRFSARGGIGVMVLLSEISLRLARRGGRAVYVRWQERFYRVEDAMRELRELGTDAVSTMVLGKLREPRQAREQAVLTGLEIAESFRNEGREVLLLVDAPPSGELRLDAVRPRLGTFQGGSITLILFDLRLPNIGLEAPTIEPEMWDTRIVFDDSLARSGLYPAVDGVASASRLLQDGLVDAEHRRVAGHVQSLLRQDPGAGADAASIANVATRARRLRQFQSQPFFVAEPWTARPGEAVAFGDSLSGYSTIASGAADGFSETDLLYRGRYPGPSA